MDPTELHAKDIFETITRRELVEWDIPPRQGEVDFRCLASPTLSLEVKRLTEQDFHAAHARIDQVDSFVPSAVLKLNWRVTLQVPTSGRKVPLVDVRGLPARLEPVLAELERRKIFTTQGASYDIDVVNRRLVGPVFEFQRLTRGGLALAHEPSPRLPPGITFSGGWGRVCSDDPDVLAGLIAEFLVGDSKEAINLRAKLARSTDQHRHAFLILTHAIDQAWLFDDWGAARLPTLPIELPPDIGCVWVTRSGPTVWRFDRQSGWSGSRVARGDHIANQIQTPTSRCTE